MPNDIDTLVEAFPHPNINGIQGEPTFTSLTKLQLTLAANAASIHNNFGTGLHGHLALAVPANIYLCKTGFLWVSPTNPGAQPIIPPNASAPQRSAIEKQHTKELRVWRLHHNVDKALKQMLLGAVNPMYIEAQSNRITGLATISTLQLLTHLFTVYGKITANDIADNNKNLRKPYDPLQPIELLFRQIEEAVAYAIAANTPYTPPMIIATAFALIQNTGVYPNAVRAWNRLDTAESTWAAFKAHFTSAHNEYCDSLITSKSAGYQTAYHAQQQDHLLAHLATSAAHDTAAISQLSKDKTALQQALAVTNQRLDHALAAIATTNATQQCPPAALCPASYGPPAAKCVKFCSTNYCWTHGYWVNKDHTSATCAKPAPGHRTKATRTNTLGGSDRNKDRALWCA